MSLRKKWQNYFVWFIFYPVFTYLAVIVGSFIAMSVMKFTNPQEQINDSAVIVVIMIFVFFWITAAVRIHDHKL